MFLSHLTRVAFATSALLAFEKVAQAGPIVLATFTAELTREFECVLCPQPFGYYDISTYDFVEGHSTAYLFGAIDGVGSGIRLPRGTFGVYDFDETNAPGFAATVAHLTDAINGSLIFHFPGVDFNHRALEANGFGPNHFGSELLTARTIESFRFILDERVTHTDHDTTVVDLRAQWQVWGRGEPIPTDPPIKIPSPGTLWLSFVGAAWLCYRRNVASVQCLLQALEPDTKPCRPTRD